MHVGVLGGTRFLGFHLVQALLARGARVSIFHRGRSIEPAPFCGPVERVQGDRERPASLAPFFRRDYNAVVDLSGFAPRHVDPMLSTWRERIGHYLFCSTSSVYRTPVPLRFDEQAPLTREPGTYGGDKVLAEDALMRAFARDGWPVTVFRPQGVFGPFNAQQAEYVFQRAAAGAPVLIRPETAGRRINFTWVHDLVGCVIRAIGEPGAFGQTFNVAGDDISTPADFSALAARVSGAATLSVAVLDDRVAARLPQLGLQWLPHDLVASNARIRERLSLTPTSLEEGLMQTWQWALGQPRRLLTSPQRWESQGRNGQLPAWWNELAWQIADGVRPRVDGMLARLGRASRS